MAYKADLQIHFYEGDSAAILLAFNTPLANRNYDQLLLFNCLTLRQFQNLAHTPLALQLAVMISAWDWKMATSRWAHSQSEHVPDLIPYPGREGKKRIFATLEFGNGRVLFQLNPQGYGIFDASVNFNFYASPILFGYYLARENAHDLTFIGQLNEASHSCALAFTQGMISVPSQPRLALEIAKNVTEQATLN